MYLIVGLGNPGEKYENTRHNLGFKALDLLAGPAAAWENKYDSQFLKLQDVILAKPQTFMNDSGKTVAQILKFYPDAELIVVHDELDLELGALRVQKNISAAGHNGVKSIIEEIGSQDFTRVRLGSNNPTLRGEIPGETYVLQNFDASEEPLVKEILEKSLSAIETIQTEGNQNITVKYDKVWHKKKTCCTRTTGPLVFIFCLAGSQAVALTLIQHEGSEGKAREVGTNFRKYNRRIPRLLRSSTPAVLSAVPH